MHLTPCGGKDVSSFLRPYVPILIPEFMSLHPTNVDGENWSKNTPYLGNIAVGG